MTRHGINWLPSVGDLHSRDKIAAQEGDAVWVESEDVAFVFAAGQWARFSSSENDEERREREVRELARTA